MSVAIGPGATRKTPDDVAAMLQAVRIELDIDADGKADALTDGLLIIRFLFGLRDAPLVNGAISAGATRSTTPIEAYLKGLSP